MGTVRAVRALPSILKKRAATEDEQLAAIGALVAHLGLGERFQELKGTLPAGGELGRAYLCELALGLMREFIPAFRPKRERNAPFAEQAYRDWIAAGGGLLGCPWDYKHFYQAMLVKVVADLEREKKKSREWIFGWLANEQSPGSPSEAKRRRSLLSLPFQGRRTSKSLRQAFNIIPKDVKQHPERYLPSPKRQGEWNFLGFPGLAPNLSGSPVRGLLQG
jgi:hypothetical protein